MESRSGRILIVDDEEDLTWSISRSLMRGTDLLEVICVNSGDQALEELKKNSIDLIISDIRMPGKNGLDLLDQVRKHHPKTKMIIMTAYGSPAIEEKIKKTKNVYYIEKPFDIHDLKEMINKINWDEANFKSSLEPQNLSLMRRENYG